MKKRTEWYDDNISDIEDDLPFLPESMKKQKALEEENNDQNNQKKSEELVCAEHDEQDYPPDMEKTNPAVEDAMETVSSVMQNDDIVENDTFDRDAHYSERKYIVLIIYDIISNKQRLKIAKLLSGYGNRVQKSAFEARLDKKRYARMLMDLKKILKSEDNVRIYKLYSYGEIKTFGDKRYEIMEDVIVI